MRAWSRDIVVVGFVAFSIIFLTELTDIGGIVLKDYSVYWASKSPLEYGVWCEKTEAFVSMKKAGLTRESPRKRGSRL